MGEKSTHLSPKCLGLRTVSQSWSIAISIFLLTIQMSLVRSTENLLPDGRGLSPWEDYDDQQEEPRDQLQNFPFNSIENLEEMGEDDGNYPKLLNTPLPLLLMKMKRHLGSVAATSGRRLPPQHLELTSNNDFGSTGVGMKSMGNYPFKRGVPMPIFKFLIRRPYARPGPTKQRSPRGNEKNNNFDPKPFQEDDKDDNEDQRDKSKNVMSAFRGKRFMGSMARGGWFPRQFRSYVSGPQWDKRHVGAVARLGWMPHSKFNRQNELSYKRNLASLRKNQIWIPKGEENQLNPNMN